MMDDESGLINPTSTLTLLSSLSLKHESTLALIRTHQPFSKPSQIQQKPFHAYLNRLNGVILSRDESTGERRPAWEVARCIVEQDEEGAVIIGWGKGWIGVCMGLISSAQTSSNSLAGPLALLTTLVLVSPQYPSFERESVHPTTGKMAVSLTKLVEKFTIEERLDYETISHVLDALVQLIPHTPTPFRPLATSIRSHLLRLVHNQETPHEIRIASADGIARLHLTVGKAQAGGAWSMEMRDAVAGIAASTNGIIADGWEEDVGGAVIPPSRDLGVVLPVDAGERLPIALDMLGGWTEIILGLLRYPTARPVAIPIAQLVAAALRCLNLTLHTPTVPYISPQHHAALLAALPRIWTSGVLLLGSVAVACGDHLFPHLSNILDHTVYLLEQIPSSMTGTQIQLIKLHDLLLTLYPADLLPLEYPMRLLKFMLTRVGSLLDPKPETASISANGGGKRGKKRQRGQEDVLVGDLEGRQSRAVSEANAQVILEALKLIPLLHPTPLLQPTLLTFSIRLHLSLYLKLPNTPYTSFSDPADHSLISQAVEDVLSKALTMSGNESGSSKGWKAILLGVLQPRDSFDALLHPAVPPMIRPNPPLSQLHYFAPENEEERKLRLEMGFTTDQDGEISRNYQDANEDVDVGDVEMVEDAREVVSALVDCVATSEVREEAPKMPELGRSKSLRVGGEAKTAVALTGDGDVVMSKDLAQENTPSTSKGAITIPAESSGGSGAEHGVVGGFMEIAKGKGKAKADDEGVVVETRVEETRSMAVDDDDEAIPELDSGSSGFGDDDDDEEDDL